MKNTNTSIKSKISIKIKKSEVINTNYGATTGFAGTILPTNSGDHSGVEMVFIGE